MPTSDRQADTHARREREMPKLATDNESQVCKCQRRSGRKPENKKQIWLLSCLGSLGKRNKRFRAKFVKQVICSEPMARSALDCIRTLMGKKLRRSLRLLAKDASPGEPTDSAQLRSGITTEGEEDVEIKEGEEGVENAEGVENTEGDETPSSDSDGSSDAYEAPRAKTALPESGRLKRGAHAKREKKRALSKSRYDYI